MASLTRLVATGALTLLLAVGCAAATHHPSTTRSTGKFAIVLTHPNVQSTGIPGTALRGLRRHRVVLLSPSRVVFITTGGTSCAWWPARLTMQRPSEIRIDMRVNGRVSACGSGAVGFPIAVTFDPRVIDIRRPVTVRLAYMVRLPNGGGLRRWNRTSVAPAIGPS